MGGEDEKKWLEEAMKAYTFDDVNRLSEICQEMATECQNEYKGKKGDELYEMLEELMEIIELHERNSLNIVKCGGFESLLKFMVAHPDDEARKLSCQIYSQIVQNHAEIQKFAMKLNSLTLLQKQYLAEEKNSNKEAIIGSISNLLRAENYAGKSEFVMK